MQRKTLDSGSNCVTTLFIGLCYCDRGGIVAA